jgi:prepilin-type processing-associated H-X9-DG protein
MNPGSVPEQPMYQPFGAPPPKQKTPVWIFVLVGCCGCGVVAIPIIAAILFPVFAQARAKAQQVSCLSNVKMQSLGLLMYVEDYDETFPRSKTWMDNIDSYVKHPTAFHCPSVADKDAFGYAFDSRLGGKLLGKIAEPRTTMMNYDSSMLTRNATDEGTSLDLTRHSHGGNAGYVDGHAHYLRADMGESP